MYTLKDIFDFNSEENKNNKKEISELNRMKHLNETYQKRGEFIKDEQKKEINLEKLSEESSRLKKLSNHRIIKENSGIPNSIPFMDTKMPGQGETVNNFLPTISNASKNSAFSYIKPEEALEISIKRAIESGSPINDMGFYDEVNWHLNNLGFDSKLPLDIKTCLVKIVGRDINTSLD